jgi:DNA-binding CsgD family transcriptional regulator
VIESGIRLLERERELELIEDRIEAARDARGSLLLFEGPAGIGKSELLAATSSRAEDSGFQVLAARGGELEQGLAFGVVRQLLEGRIAAAEEQERQRVLAGAAALAAPALGLAGHDAPVEGGLGSGDPSAAIQHGLYWVAANLAEHSPLLLSVDDLQWADPASVRWLVYLARRLEGLSVLIAASVRSGEPGPDPGLVAALPAEARAEVLRPVALSEAASAEIVRASLGPEATDPFCVACHRASGGNPFLLRELVEALRRDETPPDEGSVGQVEALTPETVSRATLLRIARLPEAAEPLARAVAVLGSEADLRHAAVLAGLDDDVTAKAADALAAASILGPGLPFRFAHPLLRAAVYDQIPEAERALAHARAASLLAAESAPVERIATQLVVAQPLGEDWAVDQLRDAAATALGRGVPEAAIAYLRRALEEPVIPAQRTVLLRELLQAGLAAMDLSVFDDIPGDPVGELTRDDETVLAASGALGPWLFVSGRVDEGTALAERAIDLALERGDARLAMRNELSVLAGLEIEPPAALERLERYKSRIEPGSREERTWLAMRAWWGGFAGEPASEVAELARRALDAGKLIVEERTTPIAGQAILVLIRADELDEAETWTERLIADGRRSGWMGSAISGLGVHGFLARYRGDLPLAIDEGREALDLARQNRLILAVPLQAAWLVEALVEAGDLEGAEQQLATNGLLGDIPDHYWIRAARFARARLRLAQARGDEALADLRHLLGLTRSYTAVYPLASMIALETVDEDPAGAERLLEHELAAARRWGTARAIGFALRAQGLARGGEDGIGLLREAAETLSNSPARLERARVLADLGAALRRSGQRAKAREVLRNALDLAHRCGAAPIADRAREELAATGAKPRREVLTGVESLTPSELRVARLAASGMQNKEIAQELFVTVKTVETHLGHVYSKLEISSRGELGDALA